MQIRDKSGSGKLGHGIVVGSAFHTTDGENTASQEMRRLELEIGETVDLGLPMVVAGVTFTLLRKPSGSAAELPGDTARLSPVDLPGIYIVRAVTDGRWSRELELCAFTHSQMYRDAPRSYERRHQARGWLNEPNRTQDEIIERLEKST